MRGTVHAPFLAKSCSRITPACAGNSPPPIARAAPTGDHPRVCGEQSTTVSGMTTSRGSPPRVRGTAVNSAVPHSLHRITPACAGNSSAGCSICRRKSDHPRVCGEQTATPGMLWIGMGSPPRVRGTGLRRGRFPAWQGITPACAGNSMAHQTARRQRKDHPRVCGEQLSAPPYTLSKRGSPPRVRGTDAHTVIRLRKSRITPACAGNSRVSAGVMRN